jgi:hypothetical protein
MGSILVLAMACMFLAITPAQAVLIDFGVIAPTSGSISYDGAGGPLVGLNIEIDNVVGSDVPMNNGVVLTITDAVLNFTTGNLTGSTATQWNFGGGPASSITIVGDIAALGLDDAVLMSGSFGSANVFSIGNTYKIAGSSFFDWKNEVLLAYYGVDFYLNWKGNFNISFDATGLPPAGFSSSALYSGDVTNNPVPEPTTMLLIGSGLLGLGLIRRRKQVR